jgi:hypothetical protein
MQFDELLADRQAEAGAAMLAGRAGVYVLEFLENVLLLVSRQASAGVGDAHSDAFARTNDCHCDGAFVGKASSVGEEIQQHLPDAQGVDSDAREPIRHVQL